MSFLFCIGTWDKMDNAVKNQKIKETCKATRDRRKDMVCRAFEVKVVASKMPGSQKDSVNTLFREAKWFRNAYLADNTLSDKSKTVKVKVKDVFEERELTMLGSQIKQSIISEIKDSIKSLAALKKTVRRWEPSDSSHSVTALT